MIPRPDTAVLSTRNLRPSLSREGQSPRIPEGIARSVAAFRRDLPQLLGEHPGEWVAYHHNERVELGSSGRVLYRHCLERGISQDDFVVRRIVPDVARVIEDRPLAVREPRGDDR